jgi:nicotinamide-nucleotide amidase
MLASIIGVGSELTSGQIIDRNSSWISQQLKAFGVLSSLHLVVPDDRALILKALDFAASHGDTIFVTGGLGPTSDDFTRDLISEWAGKPLEFHEPSWVHVCERLSSRSIQIRDIQKQQCFFPAGAEVLINPEGTANGFYLQARHKEIFVLPGPPSEIAAIWKQGIHSRIALATKGLDKHLTYSWDTLGLGESDIAHLTETALEGVTDAEKGYRVHLPYVEVKLSFLESQQGRMKGPMERLDQALREVTVARNGQQAAEIFVDKLQALQQIEILDAVSGKYLFNRLAAVATFGLEVDPRPSLKWTFTNDEDFGEEAQTPPNEAGHARFILKSIGETEAIAEIHYKGAIRQESFEAPVIIQKNKNRRAMYFAERALIFWSRRLGGADVSL